VEWFAPLPDGTEEGWQAKDVNGIAALLTAMTASVKTVCKERPNLRKLTFVISWNLATGTQNGGRLSQRQQYENRVASWRANIPGADRIDFDLVQGSDLLDELAKDEHRGRRWFWWDEAVFGTAWLEWRHAEQVGAAVGKYRPDLQVDVPIQDDLLALGFDETVVSRFDAHCRTLRAALADLQIVPIDEDDLAGTALTRDLIDSAATVRDELRCLHLTPATADASIAWLQRLLDRCTRALNAIADAEDAHHMEHRGTSNTSSSPTRTPRERFQSFGRQGVRSALATLESMLDSVQGRALRQATYFLSGQAGSGKTHLFLDATGRAITAGRPAVFLSGARFGHGNLWESISDQLGLGHVGADVLLQAMDAAGEAASLHGSRFVIFIDALNETTPATFWHDHLPALRAAVQRYPHVALAVSCRDTYQELVRDEYEATQHLDRVHPGFAEREVEAAHQYFGHYGLEAPRLPLLLPEFTVPLFLRLYCEALAAGPTRAPAPSGHIGRIDLFERFLDKKVDQVARRLLPPVASGYALQSAREQVRSVLNALLDAFALQSRESMPARDAEAAARAALDGDASTAAALIGLLQEEGVLTRERLYLGDGQTGEGVRVVFQAFSDFLLVKRRMDRSADPVHDPEVKAWLLHGCSRGIREAAILYFPEAFGIELPDLLGLDLANHSTDNDTGPVTVSIEEELSRVLVKSLPYRDPVSINDRTRELVRQAMVYVCLSEQLEVLFTTAPLAGHPYNADRLHTFLAAIPMPKRDRSFGIATYHTFLEEAGPAARLARWAAAGPYPDYDPWVIEAACIPLCWLLSSPNRPMRDWVTKALSTLLREHLDVMRALVERFWVVDDPYVVQRVIAIAYAALLRSDEQQADNAAALAATVHRLVFTPPVRADELLLDAARGIVRWAVHQGLMPPEEAAASRPPYGLPAPGPAPSATQLAERYPSDGDLPANETYSLIKWSLMELGDFGHYVVAAGVEHFSHTRIGETVPPSEPDEPYLDPSRWEQALATLTPEQRALLESPRIADAGLRGAWSLAGGEGEPFTADELAMLRQCVVRPRRVLDRYPEEEARRWVFERTIQFGWSPARFGEQDRMISRRRDRSEHKAERWGKKYQWLAYHELLARIADNFHVADLYEDHHPYEGLHELIGDREIDPSLPAAEFASVFVRDAPSSDIWEPPPVRITQWPPEPVSFARYESDAARFMTDRASEPTMDGSLLFTDTEAVQWVALDAWFRQSDPTPDQRWRSFTQNCVVNTLLVPAEEAAALMGAMAGTAPRSLKAVISLFDTNGHTDCCYLAEIGIAGPSCYGRHDQPEPRQLDSETFNITSAVEKYQWEGSLLDCSINETVSLSLPSTLVRSTFRLRFDPHGPSWADPQGRPALVYYRLQGVDAHALLIRSDLLARVLSEHHLELVARHWWQRHYAINMDTPRASVESTTAARIDARLHVHQQVLDRRQYGVP